MRAPIIECEATLQTLDKTRIDATKSFVSKDEPAITNVEIEPEAGNGYITVFASGDSKQWFLDWVYAGASRSVVVSCRITTSSGNTITTKTIAVVSSADDKLFSSDQDLLALEPDILKWVKKGRSSFLDVHRMAQAKILEYFDEAGIRNADGTKISKNEMLDLSEVRPWSRDLTLSLIFRGLSNQVDDVFDAKAKFYMSEAKKRSDRAVLAWDHDKDGELNEGEQITLTSSVMVR